MLALVLVTLSGYAKYPVPKDLRKQAQPVTVAQVAQNPDANRGKVVIWGGKLIKIENDTNRSVLYLLKLPLAQREKPLGHVTSSGRFIASSTGFLDPEEYQRGRLVTVAGTIEGLKAESVQKSTYAYPVVAIKQIYVWPPEQKTYYYPGWYWDYYPVWGVDGDWYFHGGDLDRDDDGGNWHGRR